MTTGNRITDSRVNQAVWLDYTFPSAYSENQFRTSKNGRMMSRVWSGDDTPAYLRNVTKVKKSYVTVRTNSKGKTQLVNGSYTVRTKGSSNANYLPHYYTATYTSVYNPIMYLETSFHNKLGQLTSRRKARNDSVGSSNPTFPSVPTWTSNDDNKLIGELFATVKGGDFNFAVFAAEFNSAAGMIAQRATTIANVVVSLSKGDAISAVKMLLKENPKMSLYGKHNKVHGRIGRLSKKQVRENAASVWLELQYGWLPLMKDVRDAALMLDNHRARPPRKVFKSQSTRVTDLANTVIAGGFKAKTCFTRVTKRIIATLTQDIPTMAASGLLDPELVAWERLPFSFVVDWFIPVGDYLNARASANHLVGSFVTTVRTYSEISGLYVTTTQNPDGTSVRYVFNDNGYKQRTMKIERFVNGNLLAGLPEVKHIDKALSLGHMQNAIALLTTTLKSNLRY